jgi:L-threonylcarbamoyladenylate synthase
MDKDETRGLYGGMPFTDTAAAAELLKQGGIVAIPTETVYGLAGRIDSEAALRRIFKVKGRPFFDPLIVHVLDKAQARALTREWPAPFEDLADAFWPGPLTLVAPKTDAVSPMITSGLDTVALRCPRHPLAREILERVGVPLAAPSANRFGRTSPTQAADVEQEFGDEVAVVDGGASAIGVESTVVRIEMRPETRQEFWRLTILRPGAVSRADLKRALDPKYRIEIQRELHSASSPGSLKVHYQPDNPVVILDQTTAPVNPESEEDLRRRVENGLSRRIARVLYLELPDEPEMAARVLYREFRRLSATAGGAIVVQRRAQHQSEDWEAVWDRIERASSLTL